MKELNDRIPIIAFLSGRGGVGKTLLSVNLARLLSKSRKSILLIDLDFYNRGATALLTGTVNRDAITGYALFKHAVTRKKASGDLASMLKGRKLVQAAEFLFLLPSTVTGEIVDWMEYRCESQQIAQFLSQLVRAVAEEYGIKCIVIDCRAGPDPLSIAVAGVSTHTIIVSEPDRITWDGTLNLHRYILNQYPREARVEFLINKIPEKYELDKIRAEYEEILGRFLKSLRILGYIPFEYDIFESFGEIKFVIDELARTSMSRNIASLAIELLSEIYPSLIPEEARSIEAGTLRGASRGPRSTGLRWSRIVMMAGIIYTVVGCSLLLYGNWGLRVLLAEPIRLVGAVVAGTGIIVLLVGRIAGWFRR